ncbi:hypothetical protein SAMD00019534_026490, partial [Acytostelium subglobosum LB1]|uniref:hypothetical protein n=1 Tax=Acytostelium subglobosum LB1 TaxID=1410327 RepID=UPI000644DDCC
MYTTTSYYNVLLILLILFIVSTTTTSSTTTPTVLYVDPNSPLTYDSLCGASINQSCQSIQDALYTYSNESVGGSSLTISLADGLYTGVNNTLLSLTGYDLTIQSYNGSQANVVIDGQSINSFATVSSFSFDSTLTTSIHLSGIHFRNLYHASNISSLLFISANASTTLSLVNCSASNSSQLIGYDPTHDSTTESVSSIYVDNCMFSDINGTVILVKAPLSASYSESDQTPTAQVTATMYNSVFTTNINGYSVDVSNTAALNITGCTFRDNTAGAVNAYRSGLTIVGSTFESNTASDRGAAIQYSSQDTYSGMSVTGCTFRSNGAAVFGGAIAVYGSVATITVDTCTFNNNTASWSGGSVYLESINNLTLSNSNFSQDSAVNGASVCLNNTVVYMANLSIQQNQWNGIVLGGGVYIFGSTAVLSGLSLSNNAADKGGSVYCAKSTMSIDNCTFANNTDHTTVRNELDNIFCDTQQCLLQIDNGKQHECKAVRVVTPKTLPTGVIIGIVIGCILGSFLIILIVMILVKRSRARYSKYEPLLQK